MRVAIAGAHGKIARRLASLLVARGDEVVGLIRNPDHGADLRAEGAEPVLCDLEHDTHQQVAAAVRGSAAVVFAAGAGAGSGAARKLTVDRDGAIKLLHASAAGRSRYIMISSVGAEAPPEGDDVFSVYLRAKAEADAALVGSDRDWTIIRPGRLTDRTGTGLVRIDSDPFRGEVPRDDVATVLALLLHGPRISRQILYLNSGEESIAQALEAVGAQSADST
jgi:nucleoside-diphosphate-sugar epimerase